MPHKPASKSSPQYYKDVMAALREIRNASKVMKTYHTEDALVSMQKAIELLSTYSAQKFTYTPARGGQQNIGPAFT